MEKPKRRHEMTITLSADKLSDLVEALNEISAEIRIRGIPEARVFSDHRGYSYTLSHEVSAILPRVYREQMAAYLKWKELQRCSNSDLED